MEYEVITNLISSIGYPIVMSLLLFYQNNKNADLHKQEMDRVIEVINKLEIALTELKNKIGG